MYLQPVSLLILVLVLGGILGEINETFIEEMLKSESNVRVGGKIVLNDREHLVNQKVLRLKRRDLFDHDDRAFFASRNFMEVRKEIKASELFGLLKRMPKGALLHTHIFASVSTEYLLRNLTFHPNLYACHTNDFFKLKFFLKPTNDCNWTSLEVLRKTNKKFNKQLYKELILDPSYNKKRAWAQLAKYFKAVYPMLTYRPVFELYIEQALRELHEDNVHYVEFRGNFLNLYELNGTIWNPVESMNIFKSVIRKFKERKPEFIGAKYIVALYRVLNTDGLVETLDHVKQTVVGFDLVGEETEENSLEKIKDFLGGCIKNVSFYFHAGETNWYGSKSDLNLFYALALNSKRIGHAYSLVKHPKLLQFVIDNKIGIEVSPISNQVLGFVKDLRNHPASVLMAHGAPIVICNDDPGVWRAKGLTYDWYLAFTAMTSEDCGLETLKELALNSLELSGLDEEERKKGLGLFKKRWDRFIKSEMKERNL